jgi:LysM repeat protein
MAQGEALTGKLDFLKHKMGPLPVGVWIVAAAGIYWYLARRNKAGTGSTDPAGNVGTIDPATGYVYGSTQDTAALGSSIGGSGGGSSSGSDTSGSTIGGSYADNAAWGRAAINYLVARGIDPTEANEAVQAFLQGLPPSSPAAQADVNLAVQALNAPPTPPAATGGTNPPIVTVPGGITYAANPPTGVSVRGKTSSTVTLGWNKAANATSYTVAYGTTAAAADGSTSVSAALSSATVGGLRAGTLYYFRVQAQPARTGSASATLTTTTAASTTGGGGSSGGGSGVGSTPTRTYTIVRGDTLYGIAAKLRVSESSLYAENKTVIEDAAHRYGHPSSSNGSLIFPGTVLKY